MNSSLTARDKPGRKAQIAQRYQRAYGSTGVLEDELEGWEDEGVWPKN